MLSITYLSSASPLFTPEQLTQLLLVVRAKNRELGITGVLLYSEGNFVQTIEGPDAVVQEAFERIGADPRHRGVLEVWREQVAQRAFPDWSMGFRELSPAEADKIPGFHPFLRGRGERLVKDGQSFTPEVFFRIFRDGARHAL